MKINGDLLIGDTTAKLSDIKTLNDKLYQVGYIINTAENTINAEQGRSNTVQTLNIPKGTWIVYGHWQYQGNDLSSWTTLIGSGSNLYGAVSCYDDQGWVNMTVSGIAISNGTDTASLIIWPRGKDVTVQGSMWAVKIAN